MSKTHSRQSAVKFDEGRLYQVLIAPVVSEKATALAEQHNTVAFKVRPDATKPEIRAAIKLLFNVDALGVSVVNIQGKTRRFRNRTGRTSGVRKAYVRLKPGQDLNMNAQGA